MAMGRGCKINKKIVGSPKLHLRGKKFTSKYNPRHMGGPGGRKKENSAKPQRGCPRRGTIKRSEKTWVRKEL